MIRTFTFWARLDLNPGVQTIYYSGVPEFVE